MKIETGAVATKAMAQIHPDIWRRVTLLLIKKMIAEFSHERILQPQLVGEKEGWGEYRLYSEKAGVEYRFRARILSLHHWWIEEDSILKIAGGDTVLPDALGFITEFSDAMGIQESLLPVYMEEVAGTLYGSAWVHTHNTLPAAQLVDAGYQQMEQMMTGHPRFIPNNGRVGFDVNDYRNYAPEAASPLALLWVAGHRSNAVFTAIEALSYQQVMEQELGKEMLQQLNARLEEKGYHSDDYILFPVHPWQWYNRLLTLFTQDIASGLLVCLGYGEDLYQPQQSIRTFFNISQPHKYYVKTALGILNMGYVRILSPYFMRTTPAINEWVYGVVKNDPFFEQHGFCILREVATAGYTNRQYEAALQEDSSYKKMLAALWRESPLPLLQPGQRLSTMAALLHIDTAGNALLPELIKASGKTADTWVRCYLRCYLAPLLHCFYRYDMVFMPHGENLVLVIENYVPVKAIMKDIGEEVSVISDSVQLPENAGRIAVKVPEALKTRPLFTQVFDSIFRFIAAMLHEQGGYTENEFWKAVADTIQEYQRQFPELAHKYEKYDLFVQEITPDALNRMQILDNKKLRNRDNPFDVPSAGVLVNPVAVFAKQG